MLALSLSQPWADPVIDGLKTIENRGQVYSFRIPFPVPILIHRAKSYDHKAPLYIARVCSSLGVLPTPLLGPREPGVLIGTALIVDAFDPSNEEDKLARTTPWDRAWIMEGARWCYVLRNPQRLRYPIPYRGLPSFFTVADELIADALPEVIK